MSRILNLNYEEIRWLEGKIASFDVQKGCPVGCIVCAEDAPAYKGSMEWAKFMGIVEGIAEIRDKEKINFFPKSQRPNYHRTYPFKKSDPVYYHSKDGLRERNIHDVVNELFIGLHCVSDLVTSGWKPGDNYMQHGIEAIVADIARGRRNAKVVYSIKTVGRLAIREYLGFIKQSEARQGISLDRCNELLPQDKMSFFESSLYVQQVVKNMETLGDEAEYSVQYVKDEMGGVEEKRPELALLFSQDFVDELFSYCKEKARFKVYSDRRELRGMGRAITSLGFNPDDSIGFYLYQIKEGMNPMVTVDGYSPMERMSAAIDASGCINLYLVDAARFCSPIVPREFLLARSEYYKHKDKPLSEQYAMLANLQGRNLLR